MPYLCFYWNTCWMFSPRVRFKEECRQHLAESERRAELEKQQATQMVSGKSWAWNKLPNHWVFDGVCGQWS